MFVVWHLVTFPDLHVVPKHLQDTYSGMGGHPIRNCEVCRNLIDKFDLKSIPGVKAGMWHAYYEEPK